MASSFEDCNVMFQEFKDHMYFKVIKPIAKGSEFFTSYGSSCFWAFFFIVKKILFTKIMT